jgi:hypothetical protein
MITSESTSKEWIEKVSKSKKADKILVEKVIRALILLEKLSESDLDFIFKGGTALMLLFNSSKRLSIDIDIIVPDKNADLGKIVAEICEKSDFIRSEKQERKAGSQIDKEHYKLFFISSLTGEESYILLDVLKEEVHYKNVIEIPIESDFTQQEGVENKVKVPDYNNILGDKLTAFAPNTTGIPYRKGKKEMGMEIIKQMYDIGCLCDHADDPEVFAEVFSLFAETEIAYRDIICNVSDVLEDLIENALSVCLRQTIGKAEFDVLNRGIVQIKSFVFSEGFHLEKAITYAAKVAYIAALIKYEAKEIMRFNPTENMRDWLIKEPMNTKLNKLKKSNPEAFFYLYQLSELILDKTTS